MVKKKILFIIALSALLMLGYETLKETCFGGFTKWESHVMTVVVSSLFSGIAAYFVLKRLSYLIRSLEVEIESRKKAEEDAASQLRRNETLMREVHHRIKNNMALIESMLNIKMSGYSDAASSRIVAETVNRLRSTRMIYEKLLQSEDFLEVSTRRYLEDLVGMILETYSDKGRITAEFEIEDFRMNADILLHLGILTNEIVTNSIKHGFKGRDRGVVSLSLRSENGGIRYVVEDDGCGFPDGLDFEKAESFGLMIVNLLTSQLGGTVRLENAAGTKYVFEFRGEEAREQNLTAN